MAHSQSRQAFQICFLVVFGYYLSSLHNLDRNLIKSLVFSI